jgi:hypothetical protein
VSAGTAVRLAYPARQSFGRRSVVHAVAADRISTAAITLGRGEPLCGTFASLDPCPAGLFGEPLTCSRCLAVAESEHVTIGERA